MKTSKLIATLAVCTAILVSIVPSSAARIILVDEKSDAKVLVPSAENGGISLEDSWKNVANPLNIATWQTGVTGVGYDVSADDRYRPLIGIDVEEMQGSTQSVFIRIPFNVDGAKKVPTNKNSSKKKKALGKKKKEQTLLSKFPEPPEIDAGTP